MIFSWLTFTPSGPSGPYKREARQREQESWGETEQKKGSMSKIIRFPQPTRSQQRDWHGFWSGSTQWAHTLRAEPNHNRSLVLLSDKDWKSPCAFFSLSFNISMNLQWRHEKHNLVRFHLSCWSLSLLMLASLAAPHPTHRENHHLTGGRPPNIANWDVTCCSPQ